jgi:parallel beta-helix repeat protein
MHTVYAQGTSNQKFSVDCDKGQSIQAAVNKAIEGTKIFISGDCYEKISVNTDGLKLIASGNATLQPPLIPPGQGYPLVIRGDLVKVRNFASINGGTGVGILVTDGGSAYIISNRLENSASYGVDVQRGASATIRDNYINDNAGGGVGFNMGGHGEVSGNKIRDNGGIAVGGNGSVFVVENNKIFRNGGGVNIQQSSNGTVKGNKIRNNSFGIFVGSSSSGNIDSNTVTFNGSGIGVAGSASAWISGNTFSDNLGTGVYIGMNGSVRLSTSFMNTPNTVERNQIFGINCEPSAALEVGNDQVLTNNLPEDLFIQDGCTVIDNSPSGFPPTP